ncbi:replication protein [Klebsiella aerogenes]|uniref:replication protein n=1 Tax=Klebsiella aerogenes TaxID=548 RepID=UPI00063CAE9B|nr:replication protein [Klebsiella aerogenes]KLF53521.1 replication protein [Klebsiella aerogenes]
MSNVAYANFGVTKTPVEKKVAQLEDGYSRLANELLDATMCSGLPETELCVVMAVWRKTYGFSKKTDWISNEQLEVMIDKHYTHCSAAKSNLVRKKVLIQEGRKIGMNTNISEWQTKNNGFCKTLAKPAKKTLAEPANRIKQKLLNTKDNITKEKKDNKNILPEQVQAKRKKTSDRHEKTDLAFESIFWCAGMRKTGKQSAMKSFRTQFELWRKVNCGSPEEFAGILADDVRSRIGKQFGFDKLHPATYLNGKRWEDEKPTPQPHKPSTSSPITVSKTGYVFFDR